MNPDQAQQSSERDQLWASLRVLRAEVDRLAAGEFDPADARQRQIAVVLARIVAAELDYRAREVPAE